MHAVFRLEFSVLMLSGSVGRCPLSGFKGRLRPEALNVWGKPGSLAAARVRLTRCTGRACGGAVPGLSLVTSAALWLTEAGVILTVLLVFRPGVSVCCRLVWKKITGVIRGGDVVYASVLCGCENVFFATGAFFSFSSSPLGGWSCASTQ